MSEEQSSVDVEVVAVRDSNGEFWCVCWQADSTRHRRTAENVVDGWAKNPDLNLDRQLADEMMQRMREPE